MKNVVLLGLLLLTTALLIRCKDPNAGFSPGTGDPRIVGKWQLVERKFPADSLYYQIDSVFVIGSYVYDSTLVNGVYVKDSVFVKDHYRRDSVRVIKSIDSLKTYPSVPPQTLTFGADGQLIAEGDRMTYYNPTKFYRVDSTGNDGLGISLFIYTNRANVAFRQGIRFEGNTLYLLPRCERNCYSKFTRVP